MLMMAKTAAMLGGSGEIAAVTTWNALDRTSGMNLTNGDRTATNSSSVDRGVRATTTRSTGKYGFEITVDSLAGSNMYLGVAQSGMALVSGNGQGSGVIRETGLAYSDNSSYSAGVSYSAGTVITVCLNFALNKMWFAANGVFSGDPAAGTGGMPIPSAGSGTIFPYMMCFTSGAGATINTGQVPLSYLPSGFPAWG